MPMEAMLTSLFTLAALLVPPALLIYWIVLVVRRRDFSKSRALGWSLVIIHGIESLICIGALVLFNAFDCYMECNPGHEQVTTITTLAGIGITILYWTLTTLTHRSIKGLRPRA